MSRSRTASISPGERREALLGAVVALVLGGLLGWGVALAALVRAGLP